MGADAGIWGGFRSGWTAVQTPVTFDGGGFLSPMLDPSGSEVS